MLSLWLSIAFGLVQIPGLVVPLTEGEHMCRADVLSCMSQLPPSSPALTVRLELIIYCVFFVLCHSRMALCQYLQTLRVHSSDYCSLLHLKKNLK